MNKGKLFFTVGLPRSGKSTWANKWVKFETYSDAFNSALWNSEHLFTNATPRVIISGDDFRRALYGRAYQIEAEGAVFAMMDVATRALLSRGFDVIVDETCTTEATLIRYLRIDPEATPIFIETSEEECIARAIKTGKPYLVGPIERMAKQLKELRANWDETVDHLKHYLSQRELQDTPV